MASQIIGEKRGGSARLNQNGKSGLSFGMSGEFLVVTDSKNVSREEVLLLTPGLPIVGLQYGPFAATCTSKTATRRTDNALYWDVACEFETANEQQKSQNNDPDPTTWVPVFKVDSFISKPRVITVDKSSTPKPIRNSAKQPFEEPLTVNRLLAQFSFTQFENASQTIDDIMERNECVNDSTFSGFAARTLLLNVTGAELGYWGGFAAWRCTYSVTYDPDTHDVKLLDVGSCYLDGSDQKPYMDALNQYRIVGNLNGSGAKSADASTLTFKIYTELNFSNFIRQ
jgi:hypothetical protein